MIGLELIVFPIYRSHRICASRVTKTRVVSSLYDAGSVLHLHALVKAADTARADTWR